MLCLERITLIEIRLPLREPFRTSAGETAERRILLLHIEDAEGVSTWSECAAGAVPGYSPETIESAREAISERAAPRLLGRPIGSAADVGPLLEEELGAHPMARAAIEMGCWGLEAEREGIALSRLLGGTREQVETGISLGIASSPEALAERVAASLEEGYRRVKFKISPGADLAFALAARGAAGPDGPLSVDANGAYTLQDTRLFLELDGLDLRMIEQPLAADELGPLARLQQDLKTPLCLDESITGTHRVREMLELGSGRVVNIKPGRVGGLASAMAIHDQCRRAGIPVWCGGMLESGIGRAYNVALASLPGFALPGDLSPSRRYWDRDIVEPEWQMDATGLLKVPWSRSGIGVTVDTDRIEGLSVHSSVLRAR